MERDGWFCDGGGVAVAWWSAVECEEVERWCGGGLCGLACVFGRSESRDGCMAQWRK
jgi:hypothetical protein